ncbi:hypothetical protein pb186bvf_018654 [Paramecium bursaria]
MFVTLFVLKLGEIQFFVLFYQFATAKSINWSEKNIQLKHIISQTILNFQFDPVKYFA